MAVAVSIATRPGGGARAKAKRRPTKQDREGCTVVHLRVAARDQETIRYVFCEWERDAGVRSNQEAQVNALIDRNFARTVEAVDRHTRALAEGTIRLSLAESNFRRPKVPYAARGWPRLTARPGKAATAPSVRLDQDYAPELWTLRCGGRRRTIRCYRALSRMIATGRTLDVVVLWKLYGPTDPADRVGRQVFDTPLAHLTPAARALAERATLALRRSIAERHAGPLAAQIASVQAERLEILDRATRPDRSDPLRIRGDQVYVFEGRLEELDALERMAGADLERWAEARAEADRTFVEPREALATAVLKMLPSERESLKQEIRAQAERMIRRASTAYYAALAAVEAED